MPVPDVQSLLLPILRITGDKAEHTSLELRERIKDDFCISLQDARRVHKKGLNVWTNQVAWALAHLVMGKLVLSTRKGHYYITDNGIAMLNTHPSDLTIRQLH